jgi:hypothetical protein
MITIFLFSVSMKNKFEILIEEACTLPCPRLNGDRVLIYGAGQTGKTIERFLTSKGYVVSAFLDMYAKPGQHIEGIPVFTQDEWLNRNSPDDSSVVVAIFSPMQDLSPLLDSIRMSGFLQVINLMEFCHAFPEALSKDNVWFASKYDYRPFGAALTRLDTLLADEKSRRWLESVVRFRLTGNYALLPAPSLNDQYCPHDLPAWSNPLRFVDCGAFDGDTLKHLERHGYDFETIAAFEPDLENFRRLGKTAARYKNDICLPCALGEKTQTVYFNATANTNSHVSLRGGGEGCPSNAWRSMKRCLPLRPISSRWISKARKSTPCVAHRVSSQSIVPDWPSVSTTTLGTCGKFRS